MIIGKYSQSSHRKRMKNIGNQGFLTTPNAMGRSVPVKMPAAFQIANATNGFEHVSYGTALENVLAAVKGMFHERAHRAFGLLHGPERCLLRAVGQLP